VTTYAIPKGILREQQQLASKSEHNTLREFYLKIAKLENELKDVAATNFFKAKASRQKRKSPWELKTSSKQMKSTLAPEETLNSLELSNKDPYDKTRESDPLEAHEKTPRQRQRNRSGRRKKLTPNTAQDQMEEQNIESKMSTLELSDWDCDC